MRLFQNGGLYPSYVPRLNTLARDASTFTERRRVFLDDSGNDQGQGLDRIQRQYP